MGEGAVDSKEPQEKKLRIKQPELESTEELRHLAPKPNFSLSTSVLL